MTARPSITRQAPAKKRNRSDDVVISSIAAPVGLPVWLDSRRPSSSAFSSMMSAILSSARLRVWGVVSDHDSKAVAAASTARSTSAPLDAGTVATTSPVAGFSTSSVSPDAASIHWPPMNCWYDLTGLRVSVTGASMARRRARLPRIRVVIPGLCPSASRADQRRPSRATPRSPGRRPGLRDVSDGPCGLRARDAASLARSSRRLQGGVADGARRPGSPASGRRRRSSGLPGARRVGRPEPMGRCP